MFCKTCGKEIAPGMKFCASCGTPSVQEMKPSQNDLNQTSNTPKKVAPSYEASKKKSNILIIIMAIVIAVLLITIAMLLTDKRGEDSAAEPALENEIILTVNEYPETTEELSYCLTGTASVSGSNGVLCINGQTVAEFGENSKDVNWSKELWFTNGINSFEITLSNDDEIVESEIIEIEFDPVLLYEEGTVLVKSDEAGIFIRPTPAITNEYILYVPENDYSTEFVCLGAEYVDGEGYTWCKVRVPDGSIGWVRDDIVRSL